MRGQQVDQIIELDNTIPYKKVTGIDIHKITIEAGQIHVRLTTTYDGGVTHVEEESKDGKRKGYLITRKVEDFVWLVAQLREECPQLIIRPNIMQGGFLESMLTQKSHWDSIFMKKQVQRFFKLLATVCLKYVYRTGFKESSLFTFLDNNYEVYTSDMYEQKVFEIDEVRQGQFESHVSKAISKGLKLSQKLFSFFSPGRKEQRVEKQLSGFKMLKEKVERYISQIKRLSQGLDQVIAEFFLGIKKSLLAKKQEYLDLMEELDNLLKLIKLNIAEMESMLKEEQNFSDDSSENQLADYAVFMQDEYQQINKQLEDIINKFDRAVFKSNQQIKLSQVYPQQA